MFWEACKAYKVSYFQATMDLMRHSLPDAAEYLAEVGYPRWARSLFPGLRYSSMTSNSAESINSITRFARYLPITMLSSCFGSFGQKSDVVFDFPHRNIISRIGHKCPDSEHLISRFGNLKLPNRILSSPESDLLSLPNWKFELPNRDSHFPNRDLA
ncbi:hypothetical protein OSB04_005369 [Centaurea solstitialis]|uniref:Uncharacterized protein n=1 Tax=Centaurea solstitialis TaxID=347529 RepID=A0AA38WRE1_9ASTR|nr:hypothetical protein OSB04_005369 [Centaurea solstitialis]